jgi:hypothetical protein
MPYFLSLRSGSLRMRTRPAHRLPPFVCAALLVLGASSLAACGGSSGAGSSADTSASTAAASTTSAGAGTNGPNSAAFTKYAACLKKNGVDIPAGGPSGAPGAGNGPPSTDGGGNGGAPPGQGAGGAKFQKAQAACASLRPAGAGGGFPGGQGGAATAAFRNCLKLNGVTASTTRTSAKFKHATAACASLLPKPQQSTTTGAS